MDNEKVLKEEDTEKVSGGGSSRVYVCYKCNARFGDYIELYAHQRWHELEDQKQQQQQ